jgi:hypothetical protein
MLANLGSPTVLADAQNELWTAAYDARGKYLATAGKEGLVRVYDAMTLRLVATRQLFDHGVLSLAWAKDGNALMAGEASGAVQVLTVLGPSRADRVPAPPPDLPAVPRGMTPAENAYHRAMASAISYSGRREVLDDADRILDAALKTERTDEGTALLLVGKARTVLSRGYLQRYEHTPVSMAAASDLLKRALAKAPGLPEAHAQLGWMSHWANDDVRAKDEALLAEKGGPSGRSGVLLAEIALGAGDAEAAEKLALRTIPLQSRADVVGSYAVLERTYHWIGDHAAEDRAYEIETELEPTNAWLRGTHAERLIDRGDFDGVMDYPAAHGTLAYARSEKGAGALWGQRAVALAKSSFDDAVQASPTYAHAHYGLGACFRKLALEKHDPALLVRSNDEFEQAAKLDKDPTLANAARKENDRLAERVRAK